MDYSKYENKLPYPKKPSKPCLKTPHPSAKEAREYANEIEVYASLMEEYETQKKEYNNADLILQSQFKDDALEEVGLAKHPKKNMIWSKAYDRGHSGGYSEIFWNLEDLSEFVTEFEG